MNINLQKGRSYGRIKQFGAENIPQKNLKTHFQVRLSNELQAPNGFDIRGLKLYEKA